MSVDYSFALANTSPAIDTICPGQFRFTELGRIATQILAIIYAEQLRAEPLIVIVVLLRVLRKASCGNKFRASRGRRKDLGKEPDEK